MGASENRIEWCKLIENNWSLQEFEPDGSSQIWHFKKNLGAVPLVGHPELKYQIYFTIHYTPEDDRGLPSQRDHNILLDFEELDVPKIEIASGSLHVASALKNGVRDLIFYCSDPDRFIQEANKIIDRIKEFKIELEKNLDPQWKTYLDFP